MEAVEKKKTEIELSQLLGRDFNWNLRAFYPAAGGSLFPILTLPGWRTFSSPEGSEARFKKAPAVSGGGAIEWLEWRGTGFPEDNPGLNPPVSDLRFPPGVSEIRPEVSLGLPGTLPSPTSRFPWAPTARDLSAWLMTRAPHILMTRAQPQNSWKILQWIHLHLPTIFFLIRVDLRESSFLKAFSRTSFYEMNRKYWNRARGQMKGDTGSNIFSM